MNEVHAALRKVAPDTAAQAIVRRQHSVFKELLAESREQVGQLKRFETDIAVAIAKAIGNELQPSFKTLGTELVQAIQLLTDRIGNMNEDALQKMISQFIDKVNNLWKYRIFITIVHTTVFRLNIYYDTGMIETFSYDIFYVHYPFHLAYKPVLIALLLSSGCSLVYIATTCCAACNSFPSGPAITGNE